MPFGRSLAPQMLHRHGAHAEAVARIGRCISERGLGVVTGEVGAGKTASAAWGGNIQDAAYRYSALRAPALYHLITTECDWTPKQCPRPYQAWVLDVRQKGLLGQSSDGESREIPYDHFWPPSDYSSTR